MTGMFSRSTRSTFFGLFATKAINASRQNGNLSDRVTRSKRKKTYATLCTFLNVTTELWLRTHAHKKKIS